MKSTAVFAMALLLFLSASAQDSVQIKKKTRKDWSQLNIANRPKDHFLFQFGYNSWNNKPDSINTKGLQRSVNVYFMFDFPFKTNPRFSVGAGAGIGSDNEYFNKTFIDISGSRANTLGFYNQADTNHFKKYKLNTTYLEAPIELRFTANPETPGKSLKAALGVKVGTLLGATTKGKNFVNKDGNSINSYTEKQKAKRYFNGTRLSVMGRIGFGVFSLYASYQVNAFIKDGFGPDIRPLQIGLTISGL